MLFGPPKPGGPHVEAPTGIVLGRVARWNMEDEKRKENEVGDAKNNQVPLTQDPPDEHLFYATSLVLYTRVDIC